MAHPCFTASALDLAAVSLFVRVFININVRTLLFNMCIQHLLRLQSRFHRPAKRVRLALDVFTAVMALAVLACVPPTLSPFVPSAPVETVYNVLIAIWVFVLIVGSSVSSLLGICSQAGLLRSIRSAFCGWRRTLSRQL